MPRRHHEFISTVPAPFKKFHRAVVSTHVSTAVFKLAIIAFQGTGRPCKRRPVAPSPRRPVAPNFAY